MWLKIHFQSSFTSSNNSKVPSLIISCPTLAWWTDNLMDGFSNRWHLSSFYLTQLLINHVLSSIVKSPPFELSHKELSSALPAWINYQKPKTLLASLLLLLTHRKLNIWRNSERNSKWYKCDLETSQIFKIQQNTF